MTINQYNKIINQLLINYIHIIYMQLKKVDYFLFTCNDKKLRELGMRLVSRNLFLFFFTNYSIPQELSFSVFLSFFLLFSVVPNLTSNHRDMCNQPR